MNALIEAEGPGSFRLSGDITFDTVPSIVAQCGHWDSLPQVNIDFSGVRTADSAALALILDWAACARRSGQTLRLTHVPARLAELARINGLTPIFDGIFAD